MRWPPWRKRDEERSAGGAYADTIFGAIEAAASTKVADVSATAAVEAAAGALSRAFMSAEVDGPSWVQGAVTPVWLAQVGRSLIREGASLSVIVMGGEGDVELVPASFWNFENVDPGAQEGERERSWRARVTTYGPSTSYTRLIDRDRMVFLRWGTSPGTRYQGRGPTSWAHLTARLQGEAERSLGDESAGPLAQIIPYPRDAAGDGGDDDQLAPLKAGISAARGSALLVETTAAGLGDRAAAPQSDWKPSRLGPLPPEAMVQLADHAFARMLAACGCSPALFDDSDGTSKREGLRQWHLGTVAPLAKMLAHELSEKLQVQVGLKFDGYPRDMVSRAQVFAKLAANEDVSARQALVIAGLVEDAGSD